MEHKRPKFMDAATIKLLVINRLHGIQKAANEAIDRIHQGQAPDLATLDDPVGLIDNLTKLHEEVIVQSWECT